MKTTLTADGQINVPQEIRQTDHLGTGDLFSFDRLASGNYLLTKLPTQSPPFTVVIADDGLPVIRGNGGVITSQRVREVESQTP